MKKRAAAWITGIALMLTACGGEKAADGGAAPQEEVEISLWTYPVGNWSNPSTVSELLTDFNQKYPDISG